jgi:hypothetical protein
MHFSCIEGNYASPPFHPFIQRQLGCPCLLLLLLRSADGTRDFGSLLLLPPPLLLLNGRRALYGPAAKVHECHQVHDSPKATCCTLKADACASN